MVSGANGLIGSHVVDQLLAAGYKVRGVVRSIEQHKWMYDIFATYGSANFELVEVKDMTKHGAYDGAVKGNVR